jgi:hypothetical protein
MKLRADEGLATSTTGERHNVTARHRSGADPAARFVVTSFSATGVAPDMRMVALLSLDRAWACERLSLQRSDRAHR